jgi:MOSC domain-containing protein YiiM
MLGSVMSLQVGRVAPLGPNRVRSAFIKTPIVGSVRAEFLGLAGDEQADHNVHGGPDKAIYFYPSEHYPRWIADAPWHEPVLRPGAFGENVTTVGLDEQMIAIGDVLEIGSAQMQVTQPRQPCSKLALRFADNTLGKTMLQTGRTGWYMRVLKAGDIRAGDLIRVTRRPNSEWSIARFNHFLRRRPRPVEDMRELLQVEGLPEEWREGIRESLQNREPSE